MGAGKASHRRARLLGARTRGAPNERGMYKSPDAMPYDTWYLNDQGVALVRALSEAK